MIKDQDRSESPRQSRSVWRYAMASRAHVVIDCAAYYALMQTAMLAAEQGIMLIGWDFDTRVRLGQGRRWWSKPDRSRPPARLGWFVIWLADRRRNLQIRVLKWKFGAIRFIFRGTMILDLIRWWGHKSVDFRFDSALPLGCSHHQKIVVIDDRLAVCGGIDMTTQRWDTPQHLDYEPRRMGPRNKPYGPWHDLTLLVEGDAARALGDLGRERWQRACGQRLEPCVKQASSPWPQSVQAEFCDVELGIARTQAAWGEHPEVTEIEALFVSHIARAKAFIYVESQYFASRRVAEAMALRLSQPNPPEIIIVMPLSSEGWLAQSAMDGARVRLLHAIAARDPHQRLRSYVPFTSGGMPIYVHAKLMIVDDEVLRIGSANMNNRSMGLDTEADLFLDAARPANDRPEVRAAIARLRHTLLGEHCGIDLETVAALLEDYGSMAGMIDALPLSGRRLERFRLRELTEREKAVADSALLDPERPGELFEPINRRRGLFRRGGYLRRPE
ncbi:MAG: hypothetical protein RLZZ136_1033 [Pseudomonadota bacterium]|jgi:phosphatidylserine/phosphatidylglycerophosphate/cardiolipin synthase-like enzyme